MLWRNGGCTASISDMQRQMGWMDGRKVRNKNKIEWKMILTSPSIFAVRQMPLGAWGNLSGGLS